MHTLVLETIEPAFSRGVIPTIPLAAHRANHTAFLQLVLEGKTGVLTAPDALLNIKWQLGPGRSGGLAAIWGRRVPERYSAKEAGQAKLLAAFTEDLMDLWGDLLEKRPVAWPLNMRLGSV